MKCLGIPDIQTALVFTQCKEERTVDHPPVSEHFPCKHGRRLTFIDPKARCLQMVECSSFLFSVLLVKLSKKNLSQLSVMNLEAAAEWTC